MVADLDACNELADSLASVIKNYDILKAKDDALIQKQSDDNRNLEGQVEQITILKDSFEKGEQKAKTANKWLKGFASGFGVIALVEFVYISLQNIVYK